MYCMLYNNLQPGISGNGLRGKGKAIANMQNTDHPGCEPWLKDGTRYKSFRLTLTPHEEEILNLIAQGYLNKQIAYKYRITEQTVKNALSAIYRKLNVHNRTEAVITAIRLRGLL